MSVDLARLRILRERSASDSGREIYTRALLDSAEAIFDELEALRIERESAADCVRRALVMVAAAKDRADAEEKVRAYLARLEDREVTQG